jgi:hypothetical protein
VPLAIEVAVKVQEVNKMQREIFALVLLYAFSGVLSSHFRGGIIMVRPQPGGTPKEVGIQFSFVQSPTYNKYIICNHYAIIFIA